MAFIDTIFAMFGRQAKIDDTNKDVDGKGTLERFNELIGKDIDDNIYPLIVSLLTNVYSAINAYNRYIPYLESMLGYDGDNVSLYLSQDIAVRRKVLQHILTINGIRGTKRCYELLFNMLGLNMDSLTEYFGDNGFDSPLTFDDDIRRFDSFCPACSDYSIELSGVAANLTVDQIIAIFSIIFYNEPINAHLRAVTYNGVIVNPVLGDFDPLDFNDDFYN